MDRRTAQTLRAAQLYYSQDLNQLEIAEAMGISRPTVSRLLAEARANGIVKISLDQPTPIDADLSKELRSTLDLRDAIVVSEAHDDQLSMSLLGQAAAAMLQSLVQPGTVIAISYGRTLARMVEAFDQQVVEDVEVVQMLGSLGEGDPEIDGPELARRLAARFGATYRYVHAPAVVNTKAFCEELRSQPQISETLRRATRADIAVTSVGALDDPESSLERNGYLTDAEREEYAKKGAVGHLLAKLIDISGNEFDGYNERVLALPLEVLASKSWSICLASSAAKAAPLLGAIRAGYVNAVVVDASAATEMLELAR